VKFRIQVQVAEDGDVTDDAPVRWPESRKLVNFGLITLKAAAQVTEDFQDTPLFGRRLIAEGLIRQARNRSRNLLRTLLSGIEMFVKLGFSQDSLTMSRY
jgi:hypothetical protein